MCLLSASLLLKMTMLFGGGTQACLKTVTNVPGTITPPCALCTTNSFYVTDRCDDPDESGCAVIPPSEVVTESLSSGGCKEAAMTCPDGSFVVVSFGGNMFPVGLWSTFTMVTEFTNIVCSDDSTWLIVLGDEASPLDYIYCYNKNCTLCPNLPTPTDAQCLPPSCYPPKIEYNPSDPTPGPTCRQILIECPTISNLDPNLKFVFVDGSETIVTLAEFGGGQGGELSCSNMAMWSYTSPEGMTNLVSTISCQYM